ncbi:hypothetical protein [Novosphingobium huizhouense]|uniref:hypothetical protein n=1 Tax=Novosphingobium huizhouense TaxID=2866625 RepID=UPI001CD8FCE9|nr:hypothetical protein [Novosphingobium huizhouense]
MKYFVALALAVLPSAAFAQDPQATLREVVLAPNAEVVVTPNDTLTSKGKKLKEGAKFRLSTMFDVMQDGYVLIPKGTSGEGTVTFLTNKGAFGKSGKMEVSFDYLDFAGRRIPLTGSYRQEGEGNTGATVGAAVAVGVFSAFVTGRSATIVNGEQLRAHTVEPLHFTVPGDAPRLVTGSLVDKAAAVPAAESVAAPAAVAPAASAKN